jgi:hypothetical protein
MADGVRVSEDGRPVLFYRTRPATGREAWRVNYIHPLFSVGGAVLTEDAPADHLHQRGVFWAWRRILVDGVAVADGWVGSRLLLDVDRPIVRERQDGSVQIDVNVLWRAPVDGRIAPIIEENSTIRVLPVAEGRRRVVIDVRLRGLRSGVAIAGTDDEKGYGGLSIRLANADIVELESGGRTLRATQAGMDAGASVSFSWPTVPPPWPARVIASCTVDGQPWTRWVLRQEPSMQNCAFPGSGLAELPTDRPSHLSMTLDIS